MPASHRATRTDAVKNRQRVLDAAIDVFTRVGPDAPFTVIAREAQVGVGTVYRHFPTRAALVEEVYRSEVEALSTASTELLSKLTPESALRKWMDLFGSYLGIKASLAEALRAAEAESGRPFSNTRDQHIRSIQALLDAQPGAGSKLTAEEFLLTLGGIILTTDSPGLSAQRKHMLDFLAEAVRAPAGP